MERSMYDDSSFTTHNRENLAQIKRKFTLDLNGRGSKKSKLNSSGFNPMLTSPDLKMLKLASPELDELVKKQGGLLPTNGGFLFPNQTPIKTSTPSEYVKTFAPISSVEFIKDFQDTLDQYQNKESVIVTTSNNIGDNRIGDLQYTQLEVPSIELPCNDEQFIPAQIKEEPHTVPSSSPPVSPIDMENQEKIKLERKRLRNRIAASKCRRRKLEKISRLEDKVNALKNENTDLQNVINKLRNQVCSLKQEVMEHVTAGCQIPFAMQ